MPTLEYSGDLHAVCSELPAMFDGMKMAAVAAALYIIVRCLNLKSSTAPPEIVYQDTALSRYLLKSCPMLTKEWVFTLSESGLKFLRLLMQRELKHWSTLNLLINWLDNNKRPLVELWLTTTNRELMVLNFEILPTEGILQRLT